MTEKILNEILREIQGINRRLDGMDERFVGINHRLDGMDERFDAIDGRLMSLEIQGRVTAAKYENSTKHRGENLARVPKASGNLPTSDYPKIENLLVSGSEKLPDGTTNAWSASKSLDLIREYEEGYATDGAKGDETRSRPRRLKVAQILGVTVAQLNFGILAL